VPWLAGPAVGEMAHVALEEELGVCGRELTRQYCRITLTCARREQRREEVTGADGITRARVETGHRRRLVTVFGELTATRMAYRAAGRRTCTRRMRH
jgi:hypothetical protein